ncbi:MAG: hypothetical protein IPJ10_00020 [Flavobacteriales bacterium]|nr:hypothetical protein [Flavobacteriales bacterium]
MAQRGGEPTTLFHTATGPFSFQANADPGGLDHTRPDGQPRKEWGLLNTEDHAAALKPNDRALLQMVLEQYGELGRDALVRETYIRFPYTALRSAMAERLLNTEQRSAVAHALPTDAPEGLYTIGYEGLDLDAFLNKLIKARVAVLCDV